MTNSHAAARQLLSARLDAPLSSAEADALAAHLADCSSCRAFEQRLAAGMLGLTTLPRVPGNPAVARAVQVGVQSQPRASWLRNGLKLAGALVAFGLVGVVLVVVLRPSGGAPSRLQPGAVVGSPTAQPTATESATREHVVVPQTPSVASETPRAALPACDPQLLDFTSSVGAAAGTRGITILAAIPHDWLGQSSPQPTNTALGGEPCHLATTLMLTLIDASGKPLDIDGNGAQATLEGDLPAGPTEATFLWSNWCGDTRGILGVVAISNSMQISVSLDEPPPCNGAGQPSLLVASVAEPTNSTPTAAELPPCVGDMLDYRVYTSLPDAQGDVYVLLSATSRAGRCQFARDLALSIEDVAGNALDISGNGDAAPIAGILPNTPARLAWVWSNWCGAEAPNRLDIPLDDTGVSYSLGLAVTPACDAPGQPSELRPIAPDTAAQQLSAPVDDLPLCAPAQLSITPRVATAQSSGWFAQAGTLVISYALTTDGPPCRLVGDLTLTLTDANDQPLALAVNEHVAGLDAGLPDPNAVVSFIWNDWCGAPGPFHATADLAGTLTRVDLDNGPSCLGQDGLSELRAGGSPLALGGPEDYAGLGACVSDGYTLTTVVQPAATGVATIAVEAKVVSGPPCRMVANLRATLLDANGQPLAIDGNSSSVFVESDLPPDGAQVATFVWSNWCGNQDGVQLRIEAGQFTATIPIPATPACVTPSQPSNFKATSNN